jgi:hypothetical protein
VTTRGPLRLALDQNFPTPLINAVRGYLPADIEVRSLREIDPRLSDLDDRPLFIALHQLGWDGLITNNYKMLDVPTEIAAIVKTKAIVIAIEGLGRDPLRAVGALLLELPGLPDRIRPRTSNVFRLAYRRRLREEAWAYFQRAAQRLDQEPASLWRRVGVTDAELAEPVLPPP